MTAAALCHAPHGCASAANLLSNPSFEAGAPKASGADGATGEAFGWSYRFPTGLSYIWPQSSDTDYMPLAPVEVKTGRESLRVASRQGGDVVLHQDVPAEPGRRYAASVWVRATDADGMGFGTHWGDYAGLRVTELDRSGVAVREHPRQGLTSRNTAFQQLRVSFTTRPATATVRFQLEASIHCNYWHGMVKFDDCALDGPRPLAAQDAKKEAR